MTSSRIRAQFCATAMLAVSIAWPASSSAQIPPTAELYGLHETTITQSLFNAQGGLIWNNPFRDVTLNATFVHPATGRTINFWGYYDGDGLGNQVPGSVWRIRFMPDLVGTWTLNWSFSNGTTNSGSGSFVVSDTGIPGPLKLDPVNNKLLVDARGNPIHWRGYGIKHLGREYWDNVIPGTSTPDPNKPPYSLSLTKATQFANVIVDGRLWQGGYNAAYVSVPTGWLQLGHAQNGLRNGLWGDYVFYDLRAGAFFDVIMKRLHQRRIWSAGWITFGIQETAGLLAANQTHFVRYFIARYGAFYNYFMWSPFWEVQDLTPGNTGYVGLIDNFMAYVTSQDPWQRLQGAHDKAWPEWQDWQSIHPRQAADSSFPMRNIFRGNSRTIGSEAIGSYNKVIIGAEDIWEFCSGSFGKPRDATEVRRAMAGMLFAAVLPIYDENVDFDPPCGGVVGSGAGEGYVVGLFNWWYGTVNYRHGSFAMLNNLTSAGAICSGIPGQEYVIYRENGGTVSLNLTGAPGTFAVTAINAVTGAQVSLGTIPGGGPVAAPSPFGAVDTIVFVKKTP